MVLMEHFPRSISSEEGHFSTPSWIDDRSSSCSTISSISSSSTCGSTFLPHLGLGDIGTSQDMTVESNRSIQLEKMHSLRVHDFVFVLRSNTQLWTYAIISDRQKDTIQFVVDEAGSTKTLPKNHWLKSIRFVNKPQKKSTTAPSPSSSASSSALFMHQTDNAHNFARLFNRVVTNETMHSSPAR